MTTARATGRVTLFESVGFWHPGVEAFDPEQASVELEDWRLNKELSRAIGFSTRRSNVSELGRGTALGAFLCDCKP